VAIIGPLLAQLHQLSAPFDYRCHDCGSGLARRTRFGRAARIVFWLFAGGYLLTLNLWVFRELLWLAARLLHFLK